MKCEMAVVKLGGGAITRKSVPETVDEENLQAIAQALARFKARDGKVALVHGGGSFGHYAVSQILTERGRLLPQDSSAVQLSMLKLSIHVLRALQSHRLYPTLHPPHSLCLSPSLESCSFAPLARDISLGLLPVTYGDALPDGGSTRIVSGDDLTAKAAEALGADCAIYVIREEGVLDENGNVMRTLSSLQEVKTLRREGFDVTGGIVKKVESALLASKKVQNVRIVGVSALLDALVGNEVGTRVVQR
ncbi:MAG: isopentenyl phosphate kinase [Acidilobaceae archaeon]|nr:isopentenyl phosphate kinase [Acidilobaceae archaeon]MCX8165814.1 isopentenyl phosphate kinase [Acidilobaceae archaeon]MDW7974238.1 isopentenyl phosphate kinase [Sulfolobales archaeon]